MTRHGQLHSTDHRKARQFLKRKAREGSSEPGSPRIGVSGPAQFDWSSTGPPNQCHFRRVARETSSGTSPIPREVLDFVPDQVLDLDQQELVKCLRTSPSKSAPGPGGCTNELLCVCLDDNELLQLLFLAAEDLARGNAAAKLFIIATVTVLSEKDGRVCGIATRTSFRRLVAKTLARQFAKEMERTCAPFICVVDTCRR